MCGIAGFLGIPSARSELEAAVRAMSQSLHHRGPDAEGVWIDAAVGVALGHRRLSILDLSPAGAQPMESRSGRYIVVFNGEIYNFADLRSELEAEGVRTWNGHSDTEILLAAVERWSVEGALKKFIGMFAIALWDRKERTLVLARDRMGEKPLYYGAFDGTFLFGSEIKALREHPAFELEVDRNALTQYLRYSYVPAPLSICRGVLKLPPGTYLTLKAGTPAPAPVEYWSVYHAAKVGAEKPFQGSAEEASIELERLLGDAVVKQMVADVPLGAFLSGGIDSSTVVAMMQSRSSRPVRTFTIGFQEPTYDEAAYASRVAQHLGTQHTELYVTPADGLAVIPQLPVLYDEPLGDSSQIATFLVSALTRKHVTVSLSGDGGDELFAGYSRYGMARRIWSIIDALPLQVRRLVSGGIRSIRPDVVDSLLRPLGPFWEKFGWAGKPSSRLTAIGDVLDAASPDVLYRRILSHWKQPEELVIGGTEPRSTFDVEAPWTDEQFETSMMKLDLITYLPDDILAKVDRAAMGVSLETRVPLLDHRLVEFALSLPAKYKVRNGQTKWPLRQVLYRHVPQHLVERPKMGFGVPIDGWLRRELRDWAEALLDEGRLSRENYLKPGPVRQKWREHLSGSANWHAYLWDVLMFQAWLEKQCSR